MALKNAVRAGRTMRGFAISASHEFEECFHRSTLALRGFSCTVIKFMTDRMR
ncbi:hypothetical protein M419DRAFT_116955 [Trichoderma reesei RUT C-30]|uniref:Uncharacterized protein n=1 Tax=Hypocrea jecorina (strain ATCC 56765 / BCRC 32924 / NRRL 11460 / Rut C-30) TaxID=1344414 RepID=A0A024SJM8_HYPJR|nr:hypothetical protein M419DRAFT_116955 [Trichoderma reesei RUT C-30]